MNLTLAELYLHPLKSGAALPVREARVTETGLQFDREWMVVDADGEFVSQRELPRLALVRSELRHSELVLRAPGMIALHLRLDAAEGELKVQVWNDSMPAFDMGSLAAQWICDFLGAKGLRLAAFDTEARRLSEARWSGGVQALNTFTDGFPLLVISRASLDGLNARLKAGGHPPVGMERFRPNLVIDGVDEPHGEDHLHEITLATGDGPVVLRLTKPCPRCAIPDIDPSNGERQGHVGDLLRTYREHPRVGGAVAFGMNAVIVQGVGHLLQVGCPATATLAI